MMAPTTIAKKKFQPYDVIKIAVPYAPTPKNVACVIESKPVYPTTRLRLIPNIDQIEIKTKN